MKTSSSDLLKCLISSSFLCFCFFSLSSLNVRASFFLLTEMNSEASSVKLDAAEKLATWQSLKCTERLSRVFSHWSIWVSSSFFITFISFLNCLFFSSHSSFKASSLFWIKVSNKWLTAQAAVTYSMYINSNQPLCRSCNPLKHSQLVLLIWLESFTDDDRNAAGDLLLKIKEDRSAKHKTKTNHMWLACEQSVTQNKGRNKIPVTVRDEHAKRDQAHQWLHLRQQKQWWLQSQNCMWPWQKLREPTRWTKSAQLNLKWRCTASKHLLECRRVTAESNRSTSDLMQNVYTALNDNCSMTSNLSDNAHKTAWQRGRLQEQWQKKWHDCTWRVYQ